MLISRIKQVYQYIFSNFDDNWNNEVKKILSEEEFLIFSKMGKYDKVHSYKLYQKVKSNKNFNPQCKSPAKMAQNFSGNSICSSSSSL